MPITDYIPQKVLHDEGYISMETEQDIIQDYGFVHKDQLESVRLSIKGIARFLKVGESRVRRYVKWRNVPLDADGRLSLKEVIETDWSELTDLDDGDGQRKKTYYK